MREGSSGGSALHILHVEDDPGVRDVIHRIFSKIGHEVHSAESAESALELLATLSFDVVIMDRNMDGVDGVAATKLIRAKHGPAGLIPIIGLTGSDDERDLEACRAAGMNEVLIKPVAAKVLRETIARVVSHELERRLEHSAARQADAETEVVDLEQLAEILGESDRVELFEHLQLFLSYLPNLIDRIERAAANGIGSTLAESAHAAKGAAATAAAHALRDLLGRIETAARDGAWPEISALIAQVRPESLRVQIFVEEGMR